MQFEPENLYHIYNRGNNSQIIFFRRENYLFFLQKIRTYICPFADILAWCLMPNHFHLMVYIKFCELPISELVTGSHQLANQILKYRTLNDSISILLRSYTRAIQKQENMTGSLFQHRTKAICLTEVSGVSPVWFQTTFGTIINIPDPDMEYPQMCFNYIHQNPVKSGYVNSLLEWEFSSYRDYYGKRHGKLIIRDRASEFGLVK